MSLPPLTLSRILSRIVRQVRSSEITKERASEIILDIKNGIIENTDHLDTSLRSSLLNRLDETLKIVNR